MGLKYLWDTNIVTYFLQENFSTTGQEFMDSISAKHQPALSVITEIELLCWKTTNYNDILLVNNFILDSVVFELEHDIKLKTAQLRKSFNVKLPDAIIAATAIVKELTLISNDKGFTQISSLKLINPFTVV